MSPTRRMAMAMQVHWTVFHTLGARARSRSALPIGTPIPHPPIHLSLLTCSLVGVFLLPSISHAQFTPGRLAILMMPFTWNGTSFVSAPPAAN